MFDFVKKAPVAAALAIIFSLGIFSCAGVPSRDESQAQEGADAQDALQAQEAAQNPEASQAKKAAPMVEPQMAAAANGEQEIFLPERFEEIAAGRGAFTFKTSKPKCALYVNGDYHGLTPLKAAGLVPGRYAVQIKKKGFKTVNIAIQVKDGISDFYYIEMEADDEPERTQAQEAAQTPETSQAQEAALNQNALQAQEAAAGSPSQEAVTPAQSQETPAP